MNKTKPQTPHKNRPRQNHSKSTGGRAEKSIPKRKNKKPFVAAARYKTLYTVLSNFSILLLGGFLLKTRYCSGERPEPFWGDFLDGLLRESNKEPLKELLAARPFFSGAEVRERTFLGNLVGVFTA